MGAGLEVRLPTEGTTVKLGRPEEKAKEELSLWETFLIGRGRSGCLGPRLSHQTQRGNAGKERRK